MIDTLKTERQLLYNICNCALGYKSLSKCTEALFSEEAHKRIFRAIVEVADSPDFDGISIPPVLFYDDDALDYFTRCVEPNVNTTDSATNNASYIRRLTDARLRDAEIQRCEALIEIARNGDRGSEEREAVEAAYERKVYELTEGEEPVESTADLVDGFLDYLSFNRHVVPTQLHRLNEVISGGFVGGQLICIGARPSRGKTEILNQFAEHQSLHGHHVLYFSLEMNKFEMMSRIVLSDGSVSPRELRDFKRESCSNAFLQRISDLASNTHYHPIDSVRSAGAIINTIRKCHKRGICDIAYIDYLGLCSSENSTQQQRYREIAEMTHAFKGEAQTLNIPIVMAHQLNREAGDDHIPNMSNLRESGDVEQDADIVLLIQSPSFCPDASPAWDNHLRLVLAKHRNGERGNFHLKHNGAFKALADETDDIINQQLKNEFI